MIGRWSGSRGDVAGVVALLLLILAPTPAAAQAPARDGLWIVATPGVRPFADAVVDNALREAGLPAPRIDVTHASRALAALCSGVGTGHPDIAVITRRMQPSELQGCNAAGIGQLAELPIGYQAVALARSGDGAPASLTRAQLFLALAAWVPLGGAVAPNAAERWSDIDAALPDAPIRVVLPPEGSVLRLLLFDLMLVRGCEDAFDAAGQRIPRGRRAEICTGLRGEPAARAAHRNPSVVIEAMRRHPQGALGILAVDALGAAEAPMPVALEGALPQAETIFAGRYPASRPLYAYAKAEHVPMVDGIPLFLNAFRGDAATGHGGYLASRGLVPAR